MQFTWVVVADCDSATIYTIRRGMARLRRCAELRYPRAVAADGIDPAGGGEAQARHFAAQVARLVEDASLDRRFDELILVAAPAFLAILRDSLSRAVRDAIVAEIARDLIGDRQDALQEHVLRVL